MITNNLKLITNSQNLKLKADLRTRSYRFSLEIINLVGSFPKQRVYWIIADQLLRAATSIGANIVEAKASSSKKDFINYYQIALKSANETEYWLCLLEDANLLSAVKVEGLIAEVREIANMLASSLITMKGKRQI